MPGKLNWNKLVTKAIPKTISPIATFSDENVMAPTMATVSRTISTRNIIMPSPPWMRSTAACSSSSSKGSCFEKEISAKISTNRKKIMIKSTIITARRTSQHPKQQEWPCLFRISTTGPGWASCVEFVEIEPYIPDMIKIQWKLENTFRYCSTTSSATLRIWLSSDNQKPCSWNVLQDLEKHGEIWQWIPQRAGENHGRFPVFTKSQDLRAVHTVDKEATKKRFENRYFLKIEKIGFQVFLDDRDTRPSLTSSSHRPQTKSFDFASNYSTTSRVAIGR